MYRINDKNESIARYQTYLAAILGAGSVYPSGVFDERTRAATVKYQESLGLVADGVVSYETYDAAFRDYTATKSDEASEKQWHGTDPLPLLEGQVSNDMIHVSEVIAALAPRLLGGRRIRIGRRFSPDIADAVETLRVIFRLPKGRHVDGSLYVAMLSERDSLSKFDRI